VHLDKDHLQPGAALRSTGAARRRLMPNSRLSGCAGTALELRHFCAGTQWPLFMLG
jgi:hypothetical protein